MNTWLRTSLICGNIRWKKACPTKERLLRMYIGWYKVSKNGLFCCLNQLYNKKEGPKKLLEDFEGYIAKRRPNAYLHKI